MKKSHLALLLVVPALVLVFNLLSVENKSTFYMSWTDPSYAYLFNGTNIATGEMTVGHIDHPGTTVQTVAAVVIRATYLFTGEKENLPADVVADPERYLHVVSFVFVLINCLVLLYAGYEVLKVSGNSGLALFFQSWPVIFYTTLTCMAELRTESFLIWGVTLLVTLTFCYLHEPELSQRKKALYGVKFGVICAFLAVTKMTSIPLLIIPALLLWSWRAWLAYGAVTCIATMILLIPAWSKLKFFFDWTGRLMTHSGIYGSGEEKIIDANLFRENLVYMFTGDYAFAVSFGLTLLAMFGLLFTGKLRFSVWKNDAPVRLLVAVFIVAAGSVVMVAKHFKMHYLIPAFGILPLGLYVAYQLLAPGKLRAIFARKNVPLIAGLLLFVFCYTMDLRAYYFYPGLESRRNRTAEKMAEYAGVPRIYVIVENYSAEIPPALHFGYVYSGDLRPVYAPYLREYYPNTYFYAWGGKNFHDWENTIDLLDIVERHPKVLVSFYYPDPEIVAQAISSFMQANQPRQLFTLQNVYENPVTGEQLYELNRLASATFETDSARTISCDVETVLGYDLVSTNQQYKFWGAAIRTDKEAHSGKFSLKLDEKNPYAFSTVIPAEKGAFYEISAWRKTATDAGTLVASSENGQSFYRSGASVVEDGSNGWKKIRLKFQVPVDHPDSTLKIYTWTGGAGECYFDDLSITTRVLK